jgi:hypothetical protein
MNAAMCKPIHSDSIARVAVLACRAVTIDRQRGTTLGDLICLFHRSNTPHCRFLMICGPNGFSKPICRCRKALPGKPVRDRIVWHER